MQISGVFTAKKKDGTVYFRASVTYKEKHISLGSFESEETAGASYALASDILRGIKEYLPEDYEKVCEKNTLAFDKWIMLVNLRKSGIYCKNPVYLYGKYFDYYLDRNQIFKFNADEFFFFRNHKIQKRGGHLFYSDFGMQCSLLSRYGIRSFSVEGRDYYFKNGDSLDFRYGNLIVVNRYNGVRKNEGKGRADYEVVIHMRGNVSVGTYSNEVEAAIAYNKAADSLEERVRRRKNSQIGKKQTTNVENKILGEIKDNATSCMETRENDKKDTDYNSSKKAQAKDTVETRVERENGIACIDIKQQKKYRNWQRNYIEGISKKEYLTLYDKVKFKKSFKRYLDKM